MNRQSDEATEGRECSTEAIGGRVEPGQDDAAACAAKKVVKPSRSRPQVDHLRDHYRTSERHTCRVLLVVRGTYRNQSHREPWTELRLRIREIAQSRVRYGYRQDPRAAEPRGLAGGQVSGVPTVPGRGAIALKKRPQRKRKAARQREERFRSHGSEPGIEPGLRSGSVGFNEIANCHPVPYQWPQDPIWIPLAA